MVVNATTLARVKAMLGDAGTANDTLLGTMVENVSREIEMHICYPLARAQRTELYEVRTNAQILFLATVPVVTVDEVKIAPTYWDFASLTALTADVDYRLGPDGQLYLNLNVIDGYQKAQVKYTAGLGVDDASVISAAGALAFAADIQICEDWRRRANPATVSIPGPKGAKTLDTPHRFLPRVRELLAPYRRLVVQ